MVMLITRDVVFYMTCINHMISFVTLLSSEIVSNFVDTSCNMNYTEEMRDRRTETERHRKCLTEKERGRERERGVGGGGRLRQRRAKKKAGEGIT